MSLVELEVRRPTLGGARLGRRLDRLSVAAHAFHRFAHHPLCDRYAGEVIRVGRRARVCRGCTLALSGTALGLLAGSLFGSPAAALAGTVLALGAMVLAFGKGETPRAHSPGARPSKALTRLLPALGLSFAIASGIAGAVRHGTLVSLAWSAVSAFSGAVLLTIYRRRGPDRSPCTHCPERTGAKTCSGFREIVLRERAVMRRAGSLIHAARAR